MKETTWVRMEDGAYLSNHIQEPYLNHEVPKWCITKTASGREWVVLYFDPNKPYGYNSIRGLRPFKTLREAKHYVDVDVQNFNNLK